MPLVTAAAQLLRRFPQHFADITVRVARKTDSVLWPILFEAAGPPSGALSALEAAGALQSAACCLIIVDNIEGAAVAHAAALRLIRAALDASSYGLVAELMRFLLPPGEADAILAHVQRPAVQAAEEAPVLEPKGSSWLSWLWGGGAEPAQVRVGRAVLDAAGLLVLLVPFLGGLWGKGSLASNKNKNQQENNNSKKTTRHYHRDLLV